MMQRIVLVVLMGMSLVAGFVYADDRAFELSNEVKQGEQRPGFPTR